MRFHPDETQQMIRDSVRAFVTDRVAEQAVDWNEHGGSATARLAELADLGLLGITVPENLGGAGLDAQTLVTALEELAVGDAGLAVMVAQHNACAVTHLLAANMSDLGLMTAIAAGKSLVCWALHDNPDHLDDAKIRLRASRRDTGDWRLDGVKPAVVLGGAAADAIVIASVDDSDGPTAFLVDLGSAGVDRQAAGPLVGLRSCDLADLRFDGVLVADARRLGPVGQAGHCIDLVTAWSRLACAAIAVGVARAALRAGVNYSLERSQFGKPIAEFQAIQWMTADGATALDSARLLTAEAAWRAARSSPFRQQATMASIQAVRAAELVTDRALQMHGGYGYTVDFTVERAYRDARALRILSGSEELQRVEIARGLVA